MIDREAIAAQHERLLYGYVFDETVSDRFGAYHEPGRRERFRAIYCRVLNARFERIYPLFLRMRGQITVDELVEHRAELCDGSRMPEHADQYRTLGERLCAEHPKAEMLRELLRLERAKLLAGRGPSPTLQQLVDEAARLDDDTLARANASGGTWDGLVLHYVELRTSLKESLATVRRSVGLPEWTVRTPHSRASVLYRDPSMGVVQHWCFHSPTSLVADLQRRAAR